MKALPPDVIVVVAYPPLCCPTSTVPDCVWEAEIVLVKAGEFVGTKVVVVTVPSGEMISTRPDELPLAEASVVVVSTPPLVMVVV